MKDPHIHAEKQIMPGFGQAAMRDTILQATGLVCNMPKTVGTGCGKRRILAMCARVPEYIEKITCLACLKYLKGEYETQIQSAQAALSIPDGDSFWDGKYTRTMALEQLNTEKAALTRIITLIPKGK